MDTQTVSISISIPPSSSYCNILQNQQSKKNNDDETNEAPSSTTRSFFSGIKESLTKAVDLGTTQALRKLASNSPDSYYVVATYEEGQVNTQETEKVQVSVGRGRLNDSKRRYTTIYTDLILFRSSLPPSLHLSVCSPRPPPPPPPL